MMKECCCRYCVDGDAKGRILKKLLLAVAVLLLMALLASSPGLAQANSATTTVED